VKVITPWEEDTPLSAIGIRPPQLAASLMRPLPPHFLHGVG
jgi:hypothetical protein